MKVTISQATNAYNALGAAKTTTLEHADVLAIIKARRVLRPIVEERDAFVKDAMEKFKPADYDELVAIEHKGKDATDEEKKKHYEGVTAYYQAVNEAAEAEFAKDVDLELPVISEDALAKLVKENGWSMAQADELSILL